MNPPSKADRLRQRLNRPAPVDPDAPETPTVPTIVPAPVAPAAKPEPADPEETATEPSRPTPRRATRRPGSARPTPPVLNALEDPDIEPGRKDYRSFYVDDAPFARYRAAIYWASRNPETADEVAENMSADVEAHMLEVAAELEQRLNGGKPFRMPPATKRRGRKPRKSGQ